ncbi:MAG: hypothetical protein D6705_03900 [Deltaproteobacteria bacterium]|nr:MAG: hypothetical protein D6705_03900 [Deltaproteobacteria bacterium]
MIVDVIGDGFEYRELWLLVRDANDRWYIGPTLAHQRAIGAEPPTPRFEYLDVIPGGPAELVVTVRQEEHDIAMGLNLDDVSFYGSLHICGIGPSGRPSCASPPSFLHWREERPANPGYPVEGDLAPPSGYEYTYTIDAGRVTMRLQRGQPPKDPPRTQWEEHAIVLP